MQNKQTIVIRVAPGISINNALITTYPNPKQPGEAVTLTMDGSVIFGALSQNQKKLLFKFGSYNQKYVSVHDTNIVGQAEKAEAEKKFWLNHPGVKTKGGHNQYLSNELFHMEIVEDLEKDSYEKSAKRLQVMNLVNNLDKKTRYDLCFFFGGNPTDKKDWQIWSDLIDINSGRLIHDENIIKFFEMMKDEKKEELMDRTIIKKAIHYGIILTESNKYWTKQRDLLGMSEDDILLHYKNNSESFNFIKQEVAGVDTAGNNFEGKLKGKKEAA